MTWNPTRRQVMHGIGSAGLVSALPLTAGAADMETVARGMATRALDWLNSLGSAEREQGHYPFEGEARTDWHYTPRERPGLALRDMTPAQHAHLDTLLDYTLSEIGRVKARQIRELEVVLQQLGGSPTRRDPQNYALAVFGNPGNGAWAWRYEGHHLSLTFTVAADGTIAVTPSFWGANPARVPVEPHEGLRVMAKEQDLAFDLVRNLEENRRRTAVIADDSLGNIVTGPGRADALKEPTGLPLSAMSEENRNLALAIIETYVGNLRGDLAKANMQRIREGGVDGIHFAWAGPLSLDEPHYYRLHGPVALIEYDNTQNDANHIHSVWRDLTRDFGGDLLAEHYRHGHPHKHA